MKTVAVLTNELPPYRRGVMEQLAADGTFELTVFLSTLAEPDRTWSSPESHHGYAVREVTNIMITVRQIRADLKTQQTRWVHFPIGVIPALIRYQPDVIISGEFGLRTIFAWLYCKFWNKTLIIWSEDTIHHAAGASRMQNRLRHFLARRSDGFLAWGKAAERYLLSLGVPQERIWYCAQSVDNVYWRSQAESVDRGGLKTQLGLKGNVVLFVGRLIHRKGVEILLRSWSKLPEEIQSRNSLLIVGGGEQEEALRVMSKELGCMNTFFAGPKKPADLGAYYGIADLFVLPSLLEVWGLVVNEAMAAGLPVLCSKTAGCAEELIVEDITGHTFDPSDVEELSRLINHWLMNGPETPDRTIQEHIERWNFSESAKGISAAIQDCMDCI